MCGFCGVFHAGGITENDRRLTVRMTALLAHRGPDDEGHWSDASAALGHRRLSVIDIPGGHQPMVTEDGRVALAYNGEIYNYRDLRRELEGRGHRFRTEGDTEVLLRGYEEWGDGVVERLRGMFAFAIRDGRRRRLLLARDRLGVKPLYHATTADGRLVFASEIKALLLDPAVPRELNAARLAEQLAFGMVSGEETLFAGVRELPPGSVAVAEGGALGIRAYWTDETPAAHDGEDHVARGRSMLEDAVNSRLVSDVVVGTLNSGGLDSSLMTAIAAPHVAGRLNTFSVGFADPAFDERPFARGVAAAAGSRHHEIEVSGESLDADMDRLTWFNDEPLFTLNSIALHQIFRQARREAGVTVVLTGEGADEVFGGYGRYAVAARRAHLLRVPGLAAAARLAPPVGALGRLRRLLHPDRIVAINAFSDPSLARAVAMGEGDDPLEARRSLLPSHLGAGADLFIYDQRTYLRGLLQRQDRMSMAVGVEAREPFLDHHLVEWANGLPTLDKLAGGTTKSLLKDIAGRWLPDSISRREKNGFAVPSSEWMRSGGPLAERVHALRDPGSPAGRATDPALVGRLVTEHVSGAADHRGILWTLIAFDAWARIFLAGPTPEAPPG